MGDDDDKVFWGFGIALCKAVRFDQRAEVTAEFEPTMLCLETSFWKAKA